MPELASQPLSDADLAARRGRQWAMANLTQQMRRQPELRYLFLELTGACNLQCLHCGSSCTPAVQAPFLSAARIQDTIHAVSAYERRAHIVLSGGEPLLHPEFLEIAQCACASGLVCSVVSNATLIDAALAAQLQEAGIYSVSVSLDGDRDTHNALRQAPWAYDRALAGIAHLQAHGIPVQITSVVTRRSLPQLPQLKEIITALGVRAWKLVNVEPIGRALEQKDLLLGREDFLTLLDTIADYRAQGIPVTYGCSHFLPVLYEEQVRRTPFICLAGIGIASIRANGDMVACLDIPSHPALIQGNLYHEDFLPVWQQRYAVFRRDRTADSELCRACPVRALCGGDSFHAWDLDQAAPRYCLMTM